MNIEKRERLDERDHRLLALWAADCAERVLPYFEAKGSRDDRPRNALDAGRAWVRGGVRMTEARAAAIAAHAAARGPDLNEAQVAAARAAGHAAATAHVADHARHAAAYAVKAVRAATDSVRAATERDWQYQHLPEHLRPVAFPA